MRPIHPRCHQESKKETSNSPTGIANEVGFGERSCIVLGMEVSTAQGKGHNMHRKNGELEGRDNGLKIWVVWEEMLYRLMETSSSLGGLAKNLKILDGGNQTPLRQKLLRRDFRLFTVIVSGLFNFD